MAIEILSRCHLPIAPIDDDELVRLEDLDGLGDGHWKEMAGTPSPGIYTDERQVVIGSDGTAGTDYLDIRVTGNPANASANMGVPGTNGFFSIWAQQSMNVGGPGNQNYSCGGNTQLGGSGDISISCGGKITVGCSGGNVGDVGIGLSTSTRIQLSCGEGVEFSSPWYWFNGGYITWPSENSNFLSFHPKTGASAGPGNDNSSNYLNLNLYDYTTTTSSPTGWQGWMWSIGGSDGFQISTGGLVQVSCGGGINLSAQYCRISSGGTQIYVSDSSDYSCKWYYGDFNDGRYVALYWDSYNNNQFYLSGPYGLYISNGGATTISCSGKITLNCGGGIELSSQFLRFSGNIYDSLYLIPDPNTYSDYYNRQFSLYYNSSGGIQNRDYWTMGGSMGVQISCGGGISFSSPYHRFSGNITWWDQGSNFLTFHPHTGGSGSNYLNLYLSDFTTTDLSPTGWQGWMWGTGGSDGYMISTGGLIYLNCGGGINLSAQYCRISSGGTQISVSDSWDYSCKWYNGAFSDGRAIALYWDSSSNNQWYLSGPHGLYISNGGNTTVSCSGEFYVTCGNGIRLSSQYTELNTQITTAVGNTQFQTFVSRSGGGSGNNFSLNHFQDLSNQSGLGWTGWFWQWGGSDGVQFSHGGQFMITCGGGIYFTTADIKFSTGLFNVTGPARFDAPLTIVGGYMYLNDLPTTNPGGTNRVWRNGNQLMIT